MQVCRGRVTLLVLTALISVANGTGVTLGQTGTPKADTPFPEVQCTVEPRTVEELTQLTRQATPEPVVYMGSLPMGKEANPEVVDAVTRTVLERIACRKNGDWLRWLALATDGHIQRTALPDAGTPPPEPPTPSPVETLQGLRLLSIDDVTMLDDGHVSAIVTLDEPDDAHPAPGRTYLVFFKEVDGRWLLDGQYSWVITNGGPPRFVADLVDEQDLATPDS